MTFLREAFDRARHCARPIYQGGLRHASLLSPDLPALPREYRLPLAVALIAAVVGLLSGGYIGQNFRVGAFDRYLGNVGQAPSPGLGLALYILANNLCVALLSSIFSLFAFGAFAFLVPAVAFAQIGFVTTALSARRQLVRSSTRTARSGFCWAMCCRTASSSCRRRC